MDCVGSTRFYRLDVLAKYFKRRLCDLSALQKSKYSGLRKPYVFLDACLIRVSWNGSSKSKMQLHMKELFQGAELCSSQDIPHMRRDLIKLHWLLVKMKRSSISPLNNPKLEEEAQGLIHQSNHVREKRSDEVKMEIRYDDVNESAEAFIKRFRQQLQIQRLGSIKNYEDMLARGL
ncbi:Protein of unknown function DUF761 [Cinnamomum micranthum f. kanehirae]|uniref:Uncharacterized protein n=1 Tax=Cinnamomum micranthum f. kanehirae TaxID=337451 RepID=A0A3S3NN57_9MAGN|nr:Protein of unknown function DUF761 [Cinnamomum micranthum f. kanehirae]